MNARRSPVNVHFLRWLGCFVICDFSGNPKDYNKRNDTAGDVDRGARLVHARIISVTCWNRRRGHSFHPVRLLVVLACSLVQPVAFKLATESQVTRAAAVAVVGVVALELLVELAAHVVVAQAGFVRERRTDLRYPLRRRRRRDGGAVQFLRFLSPFGSRFGSFGSQCAKHVERVQINEQQQKVAYTHGAARLQDPGQLSVIPASGALILRCSRVPHP